MKSTFSIWSIKYYNLLFLSAREFWNTFLRFPFNGIVPDIRFQVTVQAHYEHTGMYFMKLEIII